MLFYKHHIHLITFLCFLSFTSLNGFGQSFFERSDIGIGAGGMQYQGNIRDPYIKFALQGFYTYELTDHFNVRGQLFFGSLGASDASTAQYIGTGSNSQYDRPHPFQTRIQEVSILGEYNLFNMNDGKRWTPYLFIGIGYFHYTPYHVEYISETNRFVNVKYNIDSRPRKLNVPLGGGIKYGITDNIRLFLEANVRYTTTNEIDGFVPPARYSKANDYFGSGTLGISFRLGGDYSSRKEGSGAKFNSKKCPPVY